MKCRKAVFLQQQLKGMLREELMCIWPEYVTSFFRWSVTSIGPAEALKLMDWSRWRCWILWSWPHTVSGRLHFIRFVLCLFSPSVFLPLFKETKSPKSYLNHWSHSQQGRKKSFSSSQSTQPLSSWTRVLSVTVKLMLWEGFPNGRTNFSPGIHKNAPDACSQMQNTSHMKYSPVWADTDHLGIAQGLDLQVVFLPRLYSKKKELRQHVLV